MSTKSTNSTMRGICGSCNDLKSGCLLREFWLLAGLINGIGAFSDTLAALTELSGHGFWLDPNSKRIYEALCKSFMRGRFADLEFMGKELKRDRLVSRFVDHWKYEPESPAGGVWLGSLLKRLENCHKAAAEMETEAREAGLL